MVLSVNDVQTDGILSLLNSFKYTVESACGDSY